MKQLPMGLFLLAIAVRTAIVLVFYVLGIRVFGKRVVGGMNLLDLLMVLLLGNAVQNAITTGSGELLVGLVSAATLLTMDWAMGRLFVKLPWLEKQIIGEPKILLSNGRLDRRMMRQSGVDEDEVYQAMREQGLDSLEKIRLAVLEDDGSISVIPKDH